MPELLAMIKDLPTEAVGLCLDTGHAFLNDLEPSEQVRLAGDRLIAIHMQDSDGQGEHWVPGEGRIDWEAFRAALAV